MGKRFGKKWELVCSSPAEALRIIEVNQPGLHAWIIDNAAKKYPGYKVKCTYEDGKSEYLNEETYQAQRKLKSVRFTPTVEGAGGSGGRIIIGALMIAASVSMPGVSSMFGGMMGKFLFNAGASFLLGGVIQALSPQPQLNNDTSSTDNGKGSAYFDGPVNTTAQGVPVPLIYGRVLAGSRTISAQLRIDEGPLVSPDAVQDAVNNAPPANGGSGTSGDTGLPSGGAGDISIAPGPVAYPGTDASEAVNGPPKTTVNDLATPGDGLGGGIGDVWFGGAG